MAFLLDDISRNQSIEKPCHFTRNLLSFSCISIAIDHLSFFCQSGNLWHFHLFGKSFLSLLGTIAYCYWILFATVSVKEDCQIRSGVRLLSFLFDTVVNYYNEYTFGFDGTIVRQSCHLPIVVSDVNWTSELQDSLDSGCIPDELRRSFVDNEFPFSDSASISLEETGSRWLITDNDRTYIASREQDRLNIYDSRLENALDKLSDLNQPSVEGIMEYIQSLNLPTLKYIKSLHRIEPLLQNIGKKEHCIHMFNVLLLGRILLRRLFKTDCLDDRKWQEIALSHDITYPIEAIEEEIEDFFEIYFHNRKTPRLLISSELFYSYGSFGRYLQKLVWKAAEELGFQGSQKGIFEDLVLFNLHNRRDHAVLSALFTVMAYVNEGREEEQAYSIAIPILLHNLYQWKFYAHQELANFIYKMKKAKEKKSKKPFQAVASPTGDIVYKFDDSCFVSFIFERSLGDHLRSAKEPEAKVECLLDCLEKYREGLSDIQIEVARDSSEMTRYIFTLALADFWQEWGRITSPYMGLASIGIRMYIPRGKKNLEIIVPFIAYSKSHFLQPADADLSKWKFISTDESQIIDTDRQYFKDTDDSRELMSDEETKISIRQHIESSKARQHIESSNAQNDSDKAREDAKKARENAEKAVYELNMLKLWEYVHKFSSLKSFTSLTSKDPKVKLELKSKGTFNYRKRFLAITWRGIKDSTHPMIDFTWPK